MTELFSLIEEEEVDNELRWTYLINLVIIYNFTLKELFSFLTYFLIPFFPQFFF